MASEMEHDLVTETPEPATTIDRREAIRRVTALLGGIALVGGDALLTGCRDRSSALGKDAQFTAQDVAFLDEVADTILPDTKTPGAKAAKVGAFMALMVTDTYDKRDQEAFRYGMRKVDDASMKENGVSFVQATPQQRLALVQRLDQEQKADADDRAAKAKAREQKDVGIGSAVATDTSAARTPEPPTHYFRMMKELTLLGYFTSEIGYTKAMRYVESPGRFEPCTPYVAGEPAWASHA